MATAMTSEKRKFGMHPNLLMSVIERQAGTRHKAVLEGVMNSVDAGATRIDIQATSSHLQIADNGTGMVSYEHITTFWENFGQPPVETDRKTYGEFRMGRGQLFAFGKNTWRTGKFLMEVDLKQHGTNYELRHEKEDFKGCRIDIELYEKMLPSDKAALERELRESVKYVPCQIYFNGELLSQPLSEVAWDLETEEAYFKFKPNGSLYLYNLGVLVSTPPGNTFGTGGEVVSKQRLQVNFARNDVMSTCPVWRKIKPKLEGFIRRSVNKKTTLTDDERQRLIALMLENDLDYDMAHTAKVFQDVTGRYWSLNQISPHRYGDKFTACSIGNQTGKTLHGNRMAFVFSSETVERFGFKTVEQLIGFLQTNYRWNYRQQVVDFKSMTATLDMHCEIVPEKDYTVLEQVVSAVLRQAMYSIGTGRQHARSMKFVVGKSEKADSWTDCETYIAINRKTIATVGVTAASWVHYGLLLLENRAATSPNHDQSQYTLEYYQELTQQLDEHLQRFVQACIDQFPRSVETVGREWTKDQLKAADKLAKHEAATEKLNSMLKPSDN